MEENDLKAPAEEAPPVGRSWKRLYAIVLLALAVEIAILAWFTRIFA